MKHTKGINQQMKTSLDRNFWNQRWETQQTGWDIGYASTPIVSFMDSYLDKDAKILIPGCGNAHEAAYLLEQGFKKVTLIDIAPLAIENVRKRFKENPHIEIILGDFFEHVGQYDLMLEQTFFCALEPKLRTKYANKASSLLNKNGRIVGVLFGKEFEKEGPPFGGSKEEYVSIFEKAFEIERMDLCYNSIPARKGTELFINLRRRNG